LFLESVVEFFDFAGSGFFFDVRNSWHDRPRYDQDDTALARRDTVAERVLTTVEMTTVR
jgi:hypothetical protein